MAKVDHSRVCAKCGHSIEYHNSPDGVLDYPRAMAVALRVIDKLVGTNLHPTPDTMGKVINELDGVLSVCQHVRCTCRGFEPSD